MLQRTFIRAFSVYRLSSELIVGDIIIANKNKYRIEKFLDGEIICSNIESNDITKIYDKGGYLTCTQKDKEEFNKVY